MGVCLNPSGVLVSYKIRLNLASELGSKLYVSGEFCTFSLLPKLAELCYQIYRGWVFFGCSEIL